MEPYQQRVVDERNELEKKTVALHKFIADVPASPIFAQLPGEEKSRLRRQYSAMAEYLEVLGERIAAFTP
jgi:hypothetical protein